MYIYTRAVNQHSNASLLDQILQIQQMEHGSLSIVGQGPNGPYYNLNSWENGKNCCRYVARDKVPAVQQAIQGYHKFQELTEAYARQVIEKTRAELDIGVKKKPRPQNKSRLKSSELRKTNSSD